MAVLSCTVETFALQFRKRNQQQPLPLYVGGMPESSNAILKLQ